MHPLRVFVQTAAMAGVALSLPSGTSTAKRATCTVNSVDTASDLSDCSAVVIEAFTVSSGSALMQAGDSLPAQN